MERRRKLVSAIRRSRSTRRDPGPFRDAVLVSYNGTSTRSSVDLDGGTIAEVPKCRHVDAGDMVPGVRLVCIKTRRRPLTIIGVL